MCPGNTCRRLRTILDYKEEAAMKETVTDVAKSSAISIGMSLTIFCLIGMIGDIMSGGSFNLDHYRFTKMVIGSMIVGLGFGLPTFIYRKDSLPMPVRVIIHMGTGCIIYTIVAYAVGWMGGSGNILKVMVAAVVQLTVAFIIWYLFMRYYRREAKRMNDRIQEMK